MDIILLSGLNQAGAAWLRVTGSHANCVKTNEVGGWADPFLTAPLADEN